jgi:hypothetical protein
MIIPSRAPKLPTKRPPLDAFLALTPKYTGPPIPTLGHAGFRTLSAASTPTESGYVPPGGTYTPMTTEPTTHLYDDPTAPPPSDPGVPDWSGNPPPFDYGNAIMTDPVFQQLRAMLSAQGIGNAATRHSGVQQALGQFGEIPDLTALGLDPNSPLAQMLGNDIDPATRTTAQSLTDAGLSTTAQMARAHKQGIGDLIDRMAAHGTLRGGGTGVGLNQEDQTYAGNQYQARSSLLNYLQGVQQAFANSQRDIQGQLGQGASDAVQRQLAAYQAGAPTSSSPAPPLDLSGLLASLNVNGQ